MQPRLHEVRAVVEHELKTLCIGNGQTFELKCLSAPFKALERGIDQAIHQICWALRLLPLSIFLPTLRLVFSTVLALVYT